MSESLLRRLPACVVCLCLGWSGLANGSDQIPGALPQGPVAVIHATIHPISGEVVEDGTLLFDQGKIVAVGRDVTVPEGAAVVDAAGGHLYPALFDGLTRMGLVEVPSLKASVDDAEVGSLNPNVQAQVAVNPDSELIPVTRRSGVLLALSAPRSGQIAGQAAVLQMDGWTWEDMTVKAGAGMVFSVPREGSSDEKQMKTFLEEARRYELAARSGTKVKHDLRLEAMIPILRKEQPIIVNADEWEAIVRAVTFARQQGFRLIILGGNDAVHCAELLKQEDVPVMVDGVHRLPYRKDESYDSAYTLPKRLHDAGIRFCITGGGAAGHGNVRNLPFQAGTAVAYGLPEDAALRAITLSPAEILGVADRVGSLEVGKDATFFLGTGNPLEAISEVSQAWIAGKPVDLTDRQLLLYRKYQQKYQQQAPKQNGR